MTFKRKKENSLFNEKHLLKYFKNENDAYYYTRGSDRYIDCICPLCNYEKQVRAHNLYWNGFSCPNCKDYMSYPERFVFAYLKIKKINFTHQYKVEGMNRFIDFYIPDLNVAIETHGEQHYTDNTRSKWENSYEKSIDSDKIKRKFCIENGIELVELDCSKSYFQHIENSINNSILPTINEEEKKKMVIEILENKNGKTKEILEDYKNGINAYQISKKYNVDPSHVINLAKRYNLHREYFKDGRKPIKLYCVENGVTYDSIGQTKKRLDIPTVTHIKEVAEGKREFCKDRKGNKYTFKFI